ncbi:MAG: family N-acetyltransferase [Bacteroidetes bacterium]|nr:family N-acetyltransferase [Bacteroidota bacterium]
MEPHLRRFTIDDWQAMKAIRLEALEKEPHFFGAKHSTEIVLTDEQWQDRLTDDAHWGLYDGEECVGLTAIAQAYADPTAGYLIASYIRSDYRRKGLSALYYRTRIDWAKAWGYKYLLISHRNDNDASKAANQKFGFQYTHSESATWPDGSIGDKVYYRLDL